MMEDFLGVLSNWEETFKLKERLTLNYFIFINLHGASPFISSMWFDKLLND